MMIERYLLDSLSERSKADSARIADKEIMLPVVKQKRSRQDSIRRLRMALEAGDSSALRKAGEKARPSAESLPRKLPVREPGTIIPKAITLFLRKEDENDSTFS
jgi:hypothetical protein